MLKRTTNWIIKIFFFELFFWQNSNQCWNCILVDTVTFIENMEVRVKFDQYPDKVRIKMLALRKLVIDTSLETEGINKLEETFKWGEPCYITKKGITLRMDWKPKNPT